MKQIELVLEIFYCILFAFNCVKEYNFQICVEFMLYKINHESEYKKI